MAEETKVIITLSQALEHGIKDYEVIVDKSGYQTASQLAISVIKTIVIGIVFILFALTAFLIVFVGS